MIFHNKHLLTAGLGLSLMIVAAKPSPVEPRQPGDITPSGLHLNGPTLNQQAVNLRAGSQPDWVNPAITEVQLPGQARSSVRLEGGKLSFPVAE